MIFGNSFDRQADKLFLKVRTSPIALRFIQLGSSVARRSEATGFEAVKAARLAKTTFFARLWVASSREKAILESLSHI
ncbi:hypothetical protein C4J81_10010 [Deltaproteobacteria bacterium Smac51]|nr:hypothetical protein C4J81_10010 [Deltaproteobacteria bacterium Smac51]